MSEGDPIINKVAQSGLITIDLEEWYPQGDRLHFDLKPLLFEGLILREKDLRDFLKTHDWSQYQAKYVSVNNSSDAIIPTWAYMLIASHLQPHAARIVFGTNEQLESQLFNEVFDKLDLAPFKDQRVVIKGCSKLPVPAAAYMELTRRLRPIVKSIMFGEPCSTVPVFKASNSK